MRHRKERVRVLSRKIQRAVKGAGAADDVGIALLHAAGLILCHRIKDATDAERVLGETVRALAVVESFCRSAERATDAEAPIMATSGISILVH